MRLLGPDNQMTLMLVKYDFSPGDIIKGVVGLNLEKPVKGRKLEVALIGTRNTMHRDSDGVHNQDEIIYHFELPLDGEKEYQNGQYPFEIKIQPDILLSNSMSQQINQKLEEKLGSFGSVLGQMVAGQRPIHWEVKAHIDIPMRLDVNQSRDIVISPAAMQYNNKI